MWCYYYATMCFFLWEFIINKLQLTKILMVFQQNQNFLFLLIFPALYSGYRASFSTVSSKVQLKMKKPSFSIFKNKKRKSWTTFQKSWKLSNKICLILSVALTWFKSAMLRKDELNFFLYIKKSAQRLQWKICIHHKRINDWR